MKHALAVWLSGEHVGLLVLDRGQLGFTYAQPWLTSGAARPLSCSLPLRAQAFSDQECRPFFAGLLPEGEMRRALAQQLQISLGNDFMMLDRIGGECAGAVTFLQLGEQPGSESQPPSVDWLDDEQLSVLINDMRGRPMMAGVDGVRLSLAGAQDKIPVVVEGDRVGIPKYGMPSTHILKPRIKQVTDSVINECFCLDLARALRIPTSQAHIGYVGSDSYLLVRRYDREAFEGKTRRLHQEDFCQALGVSTDIKYQSEGGPSFADCFQLVRQATRPSAMHLLNLARYAIFTNLVGNHDAHGKNYSLLYTAAGAVLAPLYDVLSTTIYPELTEKMAMKIGSKYRFTDVHGRHWQAFAEESGLGVAGVRRMLVEMASTITDVAEQLAASEPYQGNATIAQIVGVIMKRSRLTVERIRDFASK